MRIAVLTTSYPESHDDASGHFVHAEVQELTHGGASVEVFVPRGAAFGWPGVAARIREQPLRALSIPVAMAHLARRLRAAGPFDRTIAHFAIPSALPLAQVARQGGALEIVSHGGDVRLLRALPHPVRRAAVDAMLRRAQCWRFASDSLRADLASSLPADQARALDRIARVVPPSFHMPEIAREVEALRRANPSLGRTESAAGSGSPPLWVCAARLIPSKRVDWAIEHAAAQRAHLVIVGDGPERPRLEALARGARARGAKVQFLGVRPRRETLAWIAVADAVVHASEAEGLSTVVREAEALGTPIVGPPWARR
ncbi:glycosyltransferase [Pendulispora albinea]|uniref:Glycosyltransferase n=1 Tax=Pendulispora albinea TaxID=2741071 RepID=A0ABZ2M0S1_9BACT